ncbi:TPA: hypothetical protein NJZ47_005121 [Vibrio parahaemolyticus]|nr:hypothetical protein [Vibrio parahaemolyticus]HCG5287107.1 hypothetical protein [Vibrio parahaemolyticus]
MSICKQINEKVKIKAKVKEEKEKITIRKENKGNVFYLMSTVVGEKTANGSTKQVSIVKLPFTTTAPPKSIADLLARFSTQNFDREKHVVTHEIYKELMAKFTPFQEAYMQCMKEELHKKNTVVINEREEQVCKIAALIHQASDAFDELEKFDEIDVIEAQEVHQALYRVKNRLEGAKMPQEFYNILLFKEDDKKVLDNMRKKRSFTNRTKTSLLRFAKVFKQLTPFDSPGSEKELKGSEALRKEVEELAKTLETNNN